MVDHMIGEHDVRHPLCENVDFQEFFQKRFLLVALLQGCQTYGTLCL